VQDVAFLLVALAITPTQFITAVYSDPIMIISRPEYRGKAAELLKLPPSVVSVIEARDRDPKSSAGGSELLQPSPPPPPVPQHDSDDTSTLDSDLGPLFDYLQNEMGANAAGAAGLDHVEPPHVVTTLPHMREPHHESSDEMAPGATLFTRACLFALGTARN
jgi:hypothetical protein